jgi:hypothetical protein
MSSVPPKDIERELLYGLEVLLGYQRILDPRGSQTLEGGRIKINKNLYEGEGGRCAL